MSKDIHIGRKYKALFSNGLYTKLGDIIEIVQKCNNNYHYMAKNLIDNVIFDGVHKLDDPKYWELIPEPVRIVESRPRLALITND